VQPNGKVASDTKQSKAVARRERLRHDPHYKWIALSNTTLGVLMATINSSILLIALPNIFDGIKLDPLLPGNVSYLLWLILGFLVVTAVLVVSLGRIGDMYGRVKMYNLGFAIFTIFSILLSVSWLDGSAGALYLIIMRVLQEWAARSSSPTPLRSSPTRSRRTSAVWPWVSTPSRGSRGRSSG